MLLTDSDRQRVIDEEEYRLHVRAKISQPDTRSALVRAISSEHFRWIITALIIPVTAFVWGHFTSAQAEAERDARDKTEQQIRNIDLVIKLLPGLNGEDNSPARSNAIIVMKHLERVGQLPQELREAIQRTVQKLDTKVGPLNTYTSPQARADAELLVQGSPNSSELEAGASSDPSYAVPGAKVYIQIFDSASQAELARRVQRVAQELGIVAPGIENVVDVARKKGRKPPTAYDGAVILAFKKEDVSTAMKLAAVVKEKTGLVLTVRDRSDNKKLSDRVPAGQMEIWFKDPSRSG
jgi:hypothetical protein